MARRRLMLTWRGSEICCGARLVRLHDWQPLLPAGVIGRWWDFPVFKHLHDRLLCQLRTSNCLGSVTFIAFSLATRMLKPGGVPRPFWLAVRTTSTPHSSILISSLATEHTPSSTTSVSGLTRLARAAYDLMSESTPVEVSTCVMVRTLYCFDLSADSTADSSATPPSGAVSLSTLAP